MLLATLPNLNLLKLVLSVQHFTIRDDALTQTKNKHTTHIDLKCCLEAPLVVQLSLALACMRIVCQVDVKQHIQLALVGVLHTNIYSLAHMQIKNIDTATKRLRWYLQSETEKAGLPN